MCIKTHKCAFAKSQISAQIFVVPFQQKYPTGLPVGYNLFVSIHTPLPGCNSNNKQTIETPQPMSGQHINILELYHRTTPTGVGTTFSVCLLYMYYNTYNGISQQKSLNLLYFFKFSIIIKWFQIL